MTPRTIEILALCLDEALSNALQRNLSPSEFRVFAVTDPGDALQAGKTKAFHVAIIEGPRDVMNTANLVQALRVQPCNDFLPVVIIDPANARNWYPHPDYCFVQPLNYSLLCESLREAASITDLLRGN